jgi:hypothetical protein
VSRWVSVSCGRDHTVAIAEVGGEADAGVGGERELVGERGGGGEGRKRG